MYFHLDLQHNSEVHAWWFVESTHLKGAYFKRRHISTKTIVNEWFANFENGIQDLEYDFSGRSSDVDDDSLKAPLNEG